MNPKIILFLGFNSFVFNIINNKLNKFCFQKGDNTVSSKICIFGNLEVTYKLNLEFTFLLRNLLILLLIVLLLVNNVVIFSKCLYYSQFCSSNLTNI